MHASAQELPLPGTGAATAPGAGGPGAALALSLYIPGASTCGSLAFRCWVDSRPPWTVDCTRLDFKEWVSGTRNQGAKEVAFWAAQCPWGPLWGAG